MISKGKKFILSNGITVVLTIDEINILSKLADGCRSVDISEQTSYNETYVRNKVTIILNKLGATCRTHAVAISLRECIIN